MKYPALNTLLCLSFVSFACDQGADPFQAVRGETDADVLWPEVEVVAPMSFVGLVINEVDPRGEPDDWFELYNGSGIELELGGLGFSDEASQVKATLPAGTRLAAGRHLVVIASDAKVGFKLGKVESLTLFAPDGSVIDTIGWDMESASAGTWGRFPDGRGEFQVLVASPGVANVRPEPEPEPEPEPVTRCGNRVLDGGEACDGALLRDMSCLDFGFDGGVLACDPRCDRFDTAGCTKATRPQVVLNEVSSAGDDPIELLNLGAQSVELSGWSITDAGWSPEDPSTADHRWVFPAGTTLGPGQRMVLVKGTHHGFGLGGEDRVTLWDGEGSMVDEATWGAEQAVVSWCRMPDGSGPFGPCVAASVGAENVAAQGPSRALLGELYFDEPGADGAAVFTELHGTPGASLEGWTLEGVNGADGQVYRTVRLSGVFPTDGILVVAAAQASGATLAARDLVGEVDWQNGPDAVRLVDGTGRVVDAVQYGEKAGFTVGNGRPAPEPSSGESLSRTSDTQDNTRTTSSSVRRHQGLE